MSTPTWRTPPVVVVYLNGVVQGMSIVSVPALGAVLKAQLGLSDAEYGAVFLPQLVFAVIGALGGGALSRRIGLKALLVLALLAIVAAQSLLAASGAVPHALAFPALVSSRPRTERTRRAIWWRKNTGIATSPAISACTMRLPEPGSMYAKMRSIGDSLEMLSRRIAPCPPRAPAADHDSTRAASWRFGGRKAGQRAIWRRMCAS